MDWREWNGSWSRIVSGVGVLAACIVVLFGVTVAVGVPLPAIDGGSVATNDGDDVVIDDGSQGAGDGSGSGAISDEPARTDRPSNAVEGETTDDRTASEGDSDRQDRSPSPSPGTADSDDADTGGASDDGTATDDGAATDGGVSTGDGAATDDGTVTSDGGTADDGATENDASGSTDGEANDDTESDDGGASEPPNQDGTTSGTDSDAASKRVQPIRASPRPLDRVFEKTQPNGVTFDAKQWGNAWSAGWETTDGYTIVENATGYWTYAENESGSLVATDHLVGIDSPPTSTDKHVRPADADAIHAQGVQSDDAQLAAPTTGTVDFPVVMMNYNDTSTTYAPGDFQSLLFGDDPAIASGPGSVTDYYEEASYGQLTVTGNVDGWFVAANAHDYYGYDQGITNMRQLVEEAAAKSDPSVDYSQYDNDGDCVVDQFVVVHQGPGAEASGDTSDIWSHKSSINYATDDTAACGQIYIQGYVIQPEILATDGGMSTMGVFAHEFGHAFGLPDLYDTDGSSEGIGEWGLMAGGSWTYENRPGDSPVQMTAWSKAYMGWIDPPTVANGTATPAASLDDVVNASDYYQIREPGDNANGEYFYVENRQRNGFDEGLPGEGLLITHVDRSRITVDNCIASNTCNDDETDKLVDVEAADGAGDMDAGNNRGDPGDTWNSGAFDGTSTPSSAFESGPSNVAIGPIQAHGDHYDVTLAATELATLDQQWTAAVDGRTQYAAAAIGEDRIFLGGLGSEVRAVHRTNGTLDWSFARQGSLVDSTPALDDGTVFVGSGSGELYAIDATDGSSEWTLTTDSAIVSSPTVAGGTVYVGSNDGTILAVNATTGATEWTNETGDAVYSSIEVSGGTAYATTDGGTVVALDVATGAETWTRDLETDLGHSSPVAAGGTVYVAGDGVYALDATDGSTQWNRSYGGTAGSSPVLAGGSLYVGSADGSVSALSTSGSVEWSTQLSGAIGTTPLVLEDRVVVGDDTGNVTVVNRSSGAVLATHQTGSQVRASPSAVAGVAFVGNRGGNAVALANVTG